VVEPTGDEKQLYAERSHQLQRERDRLHTLRDEPAETRDGHRVTLAANIGSPADLLGALDVGAEGVGLFRTEFLFAGRESMPGEDEQVEAYRTVLERMAPHTVVVRTLDIGGDKPLPYLPQPPELNPFLGERGIRYTSAHPEILRSQLRALLRASSAGRLAIMFPMVSELEQIREGLSMLGQVRGEVGGTAEVGIMIEIPAAAAIAEQLARHVAFFSVGTNDLVQYGLAVDRTNDRIATLYHPLHPGILALLRMTADGAHAHGRWAGVCGELAGDLLAIPVLLGLGFDELSMTPSRIPAARERIRGLDLERCRALAQRALRCETAAEVEALVRRMDAGQTTPS
jgi:phosphotransferase system enzyme I (PtsI)